MSQFCYIFLWPQVPFFLHGYTFGGVPKLLYQVFLSVQYIEGDFRLEEQKLNDEIEKKVPLWDQIRFAGHSSKGRYRHCNLATIHEW